MSSVWLPILAVLGVVLALGLIVSLDRQRARLAAAERKARTGEAAARQAAERFETAADLASEAVFELDFAAGEAFLSPSFLRMLGYAPGDVEQSFELWKQFVHADDLPRIESVLGGGLVGDDDFSGEFRTIAKDGRVLWASTHLRVCERDAAGAAKRVIGVMRDVSGERAHAQALTSARREAELANESKGAFLAMMSHEIRTPLNAVIGMAQLARSQSTDPRIADYLGKIDSAAASLLVVVNDVLDFSKIEAGRMEMEHVPFELSQVLDSVASVASVAAAEKALELVIFVRPGTPMVFRGDAARLSQVLTNLVSNAVKFTEAGFVHVVVEARDTVDGHTTLSFEVSDSGIGVAQAEQSRLFQPFAQGDASVSRSHGGSGLGLAICKQLVELAGGEIGVRSSLGHGSTFWFTAPLPVVLQPDATSGLVEVDIRGLSVAVVEAQPQAAEAARCYLQAAGFDATVMDDIEAARTAVAGADPPRVLVVCARVGDEDGIDFVRSLRMAPRREGAAPPPECIVVAQPGHEADQGDAMLAGAVAFAVKPLSRAVLVDAARSAFGYHDTTRIKSDEADDASRLAGVRLLLAEDNALNQQVARELLRSLGAEVTLAGDGAEAIEQAEAHRFDAVLMDVQMPTMDGLEATRQLRSRPAFERLPVIAMTASASDADREQCREAGMNDFLAKPIDLEALATVVARWTGAGPTVTPERVSVEEQEALPASGALDTDSALRRLANNEPLYLKVLGQFAREQAGVLRKIELALAAGHRDDALRTAHTLKGLAGTIGARDLQGRAARLEVALRGPETPPQASLRELEKPLAAAIEQAVAYVAQAAGRERPAPAIVDPGDGRSLDTLLRELREELLGADAAAADTYLRLAVRLEDDGTDSRLRGLRDSIGRWDYDAALEQLDRLERSLLAATDATALVSG